LEEAPDAGVAVEAVVLTSAEAEVQEEADQAAPGKLFRGKFTAFTFTFCDSRTIFARSTIYT
jgi:hypothetical protein